jgi:hypothetical protein
MIQPSARASGMGNAYVSITEGADSLYWNPSGLGYLMKTEISATHIIYLEELNYDFISYAEPMGKIGTFGLGALALYSLDIPKTSEDSLGRFIDTGQKFSTLETAFLLGWGKQINKNFGGGICAKFINQKIADVNSSGFALDLGVKYIPSKIIKLGLNVQNIGPQIKGDNLPTNIKIGGSIAPLKDVVNINVDINYPFDSQISFGIGFERKIKHILYFRLGYNSVLE